MSSSWRSKPKHRFNRAGDLADTLADALFTRDSRQLERQHRTSHSSSKSSKTTSASSSTPSSKPSSNTALDAQSPTEPSPQTKYAEVWDACFAQALNNGGQNANVGSKPVQPDQLAQLIWVDADEAVVYAQSPVWATRVRMLAPTLVACMRQCGLPEVTRLRVRVQPTETVPVPRVREAPVMSEESAEILSDAADRTDDSLAHRLRRLARHARKTD